VKALMKTARGVGHVELREVDKPSAGPGEVLVRVAAAAVCGSDLLIEADRHVNEPPMIMGHEFSGSVAELGPEVSGWEVGDRVVQETSAWICGECDRCKGGEHHLCARKKVFGIKTDGGFAEFVRVPAWVLHRVPDTVSIEEAAMTEPACVVLHAMLEKGRVDPGDEVLIMGAGTIGLLALQIAKMAGAKRIFVAELNEKKREMAKKLGGVVLDAVKMDAAAEVIRFTGGNGADVVVECTGAEPAIVSGLNAVRRLGRFVAIGLTGRPEISIPWDDLVFRSPDIHFSLSSTHRSWERVLAALADGHVDFKPLITHRFPLDKWADAFQAMRDGEAIKCLLIP
jgi:L-iditol 2-dehydrogenase